MTNRDKCIREALEGLRERCAQVAERITSRRRMITALMNNEAVKPCEVAATIRKIDVQQHYECAVGRVIRDESLLRQVLEALEEARDALYEGHPVRVNAQKAITALRERLAEMEQEEKKMTGITEKVASLEAAAKEAYDYTNMPMEVDPRDILELTTHIQALLEERDALQVEIERLAKALNAYQMGLRYAVRVWVLSDEIVWSEETIDDAVENIIDNAKKEAGND